MRKFIYLISPNKIDKSFYVKLDKVLSFKNSAYFQLRLKKTKNNEILNIAKKIKIITKKHKVKFIVNDNFKLASKSEFDGCHLGQLDGPFENARKQLKKKIIGITCHNSKLLAKKALKINPDYIAFGSFYKSKLKPKAKKANVAIGGVNNKNYKKLIRNGAKYIAISSFIWDNPKLKPEIAIKKFK